jgi:hypothetical protein
MDAYNLKISALETKISHFVTGVVYVRPSKRNYFEQHREVARVMHCKCATVQMLLFFWGLPQQALSKVLMCSTFKKEM